MARQARLKPKTTSSIDPQEVGRFSAQAGSWWDEHGPHRPLHLLTPARTQYIERQAHSLLGRGLEGLSVLDIGCGAGIMSEALARRGAFVTGIDASHALIEAATAHGKNIRGLSYRAATAEELADEGKTFDLVMALEVIEHVSQPENFVKNAAKLVSKKGALILSTPNRTPKSFLLGIVGAEYLLRWVPVGTHDWRKFIRPSELGGMVNAAGLNVRDICGVVFNPLSGRFSLDRSDVDVDYFLSASR